MAFNDSALAGGEGRAAVPLETVKRHCCDGHAVPEVGYLGAIETGSELHAPAGAFLSVADWSVGVGPPPRYLH